MCAPTLPIRSHSAPTCFTQAELATLERRWRRRLEIQQRETAKKAAASAAAVAAGRGAPSMDGSSSEGKGSVVAKTASWLDRAKSVLNDPSEDEEEPDESKDIQSQIEAVEQLIQEGPVIQHTSAGIPVALEDAEGRASNSSSESEPADKRMRTAEDAEALVGFLRSVRASAASNEEF